MGFENTDENLHAHIVFRPHLKAVRMTFAYIVRGNEERLAMVSIFFILTENYRKSKPPLYKKGKLC